MAKKSAPSVEEAGRFAAAESKDNSIDVSNDAYLGVDPEYRNHADVAREPRKARGKDEVLERQVKFEEETKGSGFLGYTTPVPHPSEASVTNTVVGPTEEEDQDEPVEDDADSGGESTETNQSPI